MTIHEVIAAQAHSNRNKLLEFRLPSHGTFTYRIAPLYLFDRVTSCFQVCFFPGTDHWEQVGMQPHHIEATDWEQLPTK